jgi:DHA1 family multidrug resistance protein-like MFS transporter
LHFDKKILSQVAGKIAINPAKYQSLFLFFPGGEMSRVSQARSLGKYFLLVDNMLVVLGFFVVFPLISIRFVDQMGWAALMVGIALGLRQLVQQGLGIFGGAIADRFGAKPMIVTGMLMRAAGFAAMAVAHEPWVLWLSCILSGLGGTLFDPPRAALVVKLVRPHQRGRFFLS